MNYNNILDLASSLVTVKFGDEEARFRCAVGRTYFATYNCAVSVLRQVGFTVVKNSSGHESAYQQLLNCGNKEARIAARILNDLRASRNQADYHLEDNSFRNLVTIKSLIESGLDAVTKLEGCLDEPAKSDLVGHFQGKSPT